MRPSQVAWGPAFEHGFKEVLLVLEGVVEQRGVNADAKGDCLFCSLPGCLTDGDLSPGIGGRAINRHYPVDRGLSPRAESSTAGAHTRGNSA